MKLSKKMKKLLLDEIAYVITAMETEENDEKKLYYFSGIHAVVNRIFNIEYDEDLIYLHHVLKSCHEAISGRLQAMKQGQDSVILLLKDQFKMLIEIAKELSENIKKNEPFDAALKRLSVLAYSTSGNGFYLFAKGLIKF